MNSSREVVKNVLDADTSNGQINKKEKDTTENEQRGPSLDEKGGQ